jgi:hypothetical protein
MIDAVLEVVKREGPVLPVQVSKKTKLSTLFASANLSELVHYKKVMASHTKVGGSPVYYVEGQEQGLQDRLYDYLKDNEKKAFDLLKEKKVLKDDDLDQPVKAGLKSLKDFAKPLNVKVNGSSLLFWKWYLADDGEVKELVNELLQEGKKKEEKQETLKKEEPKVEKKEEKQDKKEDKKDKSEEKPIQASEAVEAPKQDTKTSPEPDDVDVSYASAGDDFSVVFQPSSSMQASLANKVSHKLEEPVDEFYDEVKKFLEPLGVEIAEANLIKKNSDIDLILDLPTPVGVARYYCRARNKKRLSDGDLTNAFVQGQIRRLPVILLSPGELTKKAFDVVNHELKGQVIFKSMIKEDI